MKSLKLRLGLGIFMSITVVFVLIWLAGSHSIRVLVEQQMLTRLQHDSETLLTNIRFDPSEKIQLNLSAVDSIYSRPFSGHYFVIDTNATRIRSRSLWDTDLEQQAAVIKTANTVRIQGPQQQTLLVLRQKYIKRGHTLTIAVAEDITALEQQIKDFRNWFGLVALIVLLGLILLQVLIVRISLSPLNRTQSQIAELEAGTRSQLDNAVPSELKPHVDAINYLLARMTQRLQKSRNAVGDLAHALKKPLTVLTQAANSTQTRDEQALRRLIREQSDNMQGSINHVLNRARLAGDGPVLAQFSLNKDLPSLLDTLGRMYPNKHIDTKFDFASLQRLPFDREDMMELLGNLLDNACKWSQQEVLLTLQVSDKVLIRVEDDGTGITAANANTILQRGERLDEQVQGHGLGLSIANNIVKAYSGHMKLEKTSHFNNGLCAEVMLPLR